MPRETDSDTATLPIAAGDKAEVDEVINAWLAQHDTLFALPQSDAAGCVECGAHGVCILDRRRARR
jgi:hypothetical protein